MSDARNAKGAPTAATVDTPKNKSGQDSPTNITTQTPTRKTRGGDLAEKIYREGGLRDRLRQIGPSTRCHHCGAHDPGFLDSAAPEQSVECDTCGHRSILARWQDAAELTDAVLAVEGPNEGTYLIGWHQGTASVSWRPTGGPCEQVAVVKPADDFGLMSHYDVSAHYKIFCALEEHGITVREEG